MILILPIMLSPAYAEDVEIPLECKDRVENLLTSKGASQMTDAELVLGLDCIAVVKHALYANLAFAIEAGFEITEAHRTQTLIWNQLEGLLTAELNRRKSGEKAKENILKEIEKQNAEFLKEERKEAKEPNRDFNKEGSDLNEMEDFNRQEVEEEKQIRKPVGELQRG